MLVAYFNLCQRPLGAQQPHMLTFLAGAGQCSSHPFECLAPSGYQCSCFERSRFDSQSRHLFTSDITSWYFIP